MCSGKSYFIQKYQDGNFIDGDDILDSLDIKNKNYYWYDQNKEEERKTIINVFEKLINQGKYYVLYSGNPEYLIDLTKLIIIPPYENRWYNCNKRLEEGNWVPDKYQFDREETAYHNSVNLDGEFIIYKGDIPDLDRMKELLN